MKLSLHVTWKAGREDGIVLISFFLLMALLVIGVTTFYVYAYADYNASLRSAYLTQAFYAAEAGIDQKIVQLTTGNATANIAGTLSANQYTGTFQVTCAPCTLANNEQLTSTGTVTVSGTNYTRVVRVTVRKSPVFNSTAAVAISGVASTNGNITVDGRDHDANGNLTGAPGLPGISTSSGTFNQGGSSAVGGNGIAPAQPANPATYLLNAPALPATPEGILGVGSGDLDAYKTSTPPATPFTNQIVYLTTSWNAPNFNGSSGILIVHNSASTAVLQNVHGGFKGLVITDDIVHINGDANILGAIVGMKTGGVTLGNGAGVVNYSSAVVSNLPLVHYSVVSWEDSKNDSVT